MILVIDNYDSFTYNLVQYLGELGAELVVHRNDQITVEQARALSPSHVVISPGPGTPHDAGVSLDLILALSGEVPILGVCLGHQCLGRAFGGLVAGAKRLMHGKTSQVRHRGDGILAGLSSPFVATRYHSLAVLPPVPPALKITAWSEDGEIMGLEHRRHPTYGVQFHPESILTEGGKDLLRNFLNVSQPHARVGSGRAAMGTPEPIGTPVCSAPDRSE
ncbi:MAG: aminodeoxychorismate/anthranilate synthase component II [Anaerolineae bacterium]|nr:aminodeoxychorismate/anthranilate synthase component II [Anaerolineae bacterium]